MRGKNLGLVLSILIGLGSAASANSLTGAYLAARQAGFDHDYKAAANYFSRALAHDPDRPEFLERATLSYFSLGNVDHARDLADRIETLGQKSAIAQITIGADLAAKGDYETLITRIDAQKGIGPLADGFVRAWALLGQGKAAEAFDAFDAIAGQEAALAGFAAYHKALALATVGDFEKAEEIFAGSTIGSLQNTRRGIIAHAQILSQLERPEDAGALIDAAFGDSLDPGLTALRETLAQGEAIAFDQITSPRDGMAEAFYTLASALSNEADPDFALLYARTALVLRPEHVDAVLLAANLLETLGQYDLAVSTYKAVPRDDPAYHASELGRAAALRMAGRVDAAIEVLESLSETHGDMPVVHTTLGDTMRQLERFDEALDAYDLAIALYPEPDAAQWRLFYARGTVYEQLGRWDEAEADFREALTLNPEQPQVLNYLGYSLVQRKQNLDEALDMIQRAVAARPESGYIVDSLGWVYYRLGLYEEAVEPMERAVELMPVDPIVNDHLGDVYWAVGRTMEAELQWRRALSFVENENSAEEVKVDRIRRKLEIGLDAVLAEEGAPPLQVANDDN